MKAPVFSLSQSIELENQRKKDLYVIDTKGKVGSGSYGDVYIAAHKGSTDYNLAVKVVHKDSLRNNEMEIWRKLKGKFLCELIDDFELKERVYCVMNRSNQGNLKHYLEARRKPDTPKNHLSQEDILSLFYKIVQGYYEMYKLKMIHRDLKPENILMHNDNPLLADFGFCRELEDMSQEILASGYGTPKFSPPESMIRPLVFNYKFDIFSLGTILYFCYYLDSPTSPRTGEQLCNYYKNLQFNPIENVIPFNRLENIKGSDRIDPLAKDLIYKMLKFNYNDRISIEEVLAHPVFNSILSELKPTLQTKTVLFQFAKSIPQTIQDVKQTQEITHNALAIHRYFAFNVGVATFGFKAVLGFSDSIFYNYIEILYFSVKLFTASLQYLNDILKTSEPQFPVPHTFHQIPQAFNNFRSSQLGQDIQKEITGSLDFANNCVAMIEVELKSKQAGNKLLQKASEAEKNNPDTNRVTLYDELFKVAVQEAGSKDESVFQKAKNANPQQFYMLLYFLERSTNINPEFNNIKINSIYEPPQSLRNGVIDHYFAFYFGNNAS